MNGVGLRATPSSTATVEEIVLISTNNILQSAYADAMTDSLDDERAQIREQMKRELQQRLENGNELGADDSTVKNPPEPIAIEGAAHLDEVIDEHEVVFVDCHSDW